MTRPISVGDLVMVVRGHSCMVKLKGGIPYVVRDLIPQKDGGWYCQKCGTSDLAKSDLIGAALWHKQRERGVPLSWLKRIDPLPENETIEHNEEVGA